MMDLAGIDAAVLTSGAGMCADLERSRFINNKAKQAERNYPGRFIGAAHVHPLGGPEALQNWPAAAPGTRFPGVVITSETDGFFLDVPDFEPFWAEAVSPGHVRFRPSGAAAQLSRSSSMPTIWPARLGREFSLIMATIRLINSRRVGSLSEPDHPDGHLSGGIASVLGRIRKYQDKEFWGTRRQSPARRPNPRHAISIGTCESASFSRHRRFLRRHSGPVKIALMELPASTSNRVCHRLSTRDSRPRSGARFCQRYPQTRTGRRNDSIRQCRCIAERAVHSPRGVSLRRRSPRTQPRSLMSRAPLGRDQERQH